MQMTLRNGDRLGEKAKRNPGKELRVSLDKSEWRQAHSESCLPVSQPSVISGGP